METVSKMELVRARFRIRCEMAGCKKASEYAVKTPRFGARASLNICSDCMKELYELIGKEVVPKPIENAMSGNKRERVSKKPAGAAIEE